MRRLRPIQVAHDLRVASRVRPQRRHEMRVGQEPDVEQQIRIDRDPVFEPEAENRDDQLGAWRRARRDAGEDVTQLVDRHLRGVQHVIGELPDGPHRGALLADPFDRRAIGRERVRPARFAEAAHQRGLRRFEKDQDGIESFAGLEPPVDPGKLPQQFSLADVHHDGRARNLRAGAQRQLREHRKERHRQIVDAEVAEVLERPYRLRFAGPRQPGEHDEPRRDGGARGPPGRVALLAHQRSSPPSASGPCPARCSLRRATSRRAA